MLKAKQATSGLKSICQALIEETEVFKSCEQPIFWNHLEIPIWLINCNNYIMEPIQKVTIQGTINNFHLLRKKGS